MEKTDGAESRKDFIYKMSIARKEAHETRYWPRVIQASLLHDLCTSIVLSYPRAVFHCRDAEDAEDFLQSLRPRRLCGVYVLINRGEVKDSGRAKEPRFLEENEALIYGNFWISSS
ncbi:MAG: four helix bundle protein [Anaerolineae bacterium]|nr:four helix bundle protein [Anaerolineae bacterium]MDH7473418.1 four helix bundle protein [Anaerolineae bacterium]